MSKSIDNLDIPARKKEYIKNVLNPVLEEMVTQVVTELPDNPALFMYNWLLKKTNSGASDPAKENSLLKAKLAEMQRATSGMQVIEAQVKSTEPVHDEEEDHSEEEKEEEQPDEVVEVSSKKMATARAAVSAEAYGKWNQKKDFKPPVHNKSAGQKERIMSMLSKSFLFSTLDAKDLGVVIDAMEEVTLAPKDRVIKQGDNGDFLFVIEKGTLDCYKKFEGEPEEKLVKTCEEGDVFGELALLYNCPRAASVESRTDCVLWKLDRETFGHIVRDGAAKKREKYEKFLKSVTLLSSIGNYELSQIADALRPRDIGANETIIQEGDAKGDTFYLLEEGSAAAFKGDSKVMDYNKPGDYFGELALLRNEPRAATVRAGSEGCRVLLLDRRSFKRLLGSLEDLLKKSASSRYA